MIAITPDPIDTDALREAVADPGHGAVLLFEGIARDDHEGRRVLELAYEAYAEMAVPVMQQIAKECEARWPVKVAMVHRVGQVPISEASVVIAVGAPHRQECYEASRFAIDELKRRVPVWKKEIYADGSAWKANAPA